MDNENNTSTPYPLSWRPVFWAAGPLMIVVGITVLVERWSGNTSYSSSAWSLWPSVFIISFGAVLMAVAKWFHPRIENRAFQVLTRWANSPWPYVLIVFLFWVSFETQQLIRNNEIATLRNDEQSIAKVIDRLVLPRRLTKTQKDQISRFLLQFEAHEYSIKRSVDDEEASGYSSDIDEALTKGGWTKDVTNPYIFSNDVPAGLSITLMQTPEHAQRNDPRNPNPSILLQEALGIAGVRSSPGGGSGAGITKDSLVISVGHARKDTFAFDLEAPQ